MTAGGVGILAVGLHLPPEVRTNDWWPADVVAGWAAQQRRAFAALAAAPPAPTAGGRAVTEAMLAMAGDPFEGSVTRPVAAADVVASDLEALAAEDAFARGRIDRDEIDLLLVYSAVPDYLLGNCACELHRRLGLRESCLAFEVQASSYSFVAQLVLALPMIESGRVGKALLVQSSLLSRLIAPTDPLAPRFGDGAAAVVVGRVARDRGVLATSYRTDAATPRTLIASVPGGHWYDGRSTVHLGDPEGARRMFLSSIDLGVRNVRESLAAAGRTADEVDFLAVNQANPWLTELIRAGAGLARADRVELFARTAYLFAASVPQALATAEAEGRLADGDLVVLVAAGTGLVSGAVTLRWGRGAS